MTRIEVEHLVKRYPQARTNAVDGISFRVRSGETFGLLGPNGAGKTRRSRPRAQPADPAASVTGVSTRRLGSCPAWPRWIVTTVDSKTREKTRLSIACMPREDAGALLSGAAQAVIREQAELLDLRLARPSLEDVFIHLTGSNLRS